MEQPESPKLVEEEFIPPVIEVTDEQKAAIARLPYLETTNSSTVIINPKTYKPPVREEEPPQPVDPNVLTPSQIINNTFEPYLRKMTKVIEHYQRSLQYSTADAGKSLEAKDCQEDLDMCYEKIFFDEDFSLNDEPTYNIVLDPQENPKVIQYKLSGYLDIIEVCLMQQISVQSEKLFLAVHQIQEFQNSVKTTLKQIDILRHHINEIDDKYVLSPLRIPTLVRRKENAKKVQVIINMMLEIRKLLTRAKKSLNRDGYDDCIKCLYRCQKLIRGDLSKIKSIKGYIEESESLKKQLVSKLTLRFIVISLGLEDHPKKSGKDSSQRHHRHKHEDDSDASDEADDEDEDSSKDDSVSMETELSSIVQYLIRLRGLKSALFEYRGKTEQQLLELINTVVNTLSPTLKEKVNSPQSTVSFMNTSSSMNSFSIDSRYEEFIRLLPHKDFLFLLDLLCEKFLECSSRAKKVNAICNNVLLYIPINDDMSQNNMDILSITANEKADISQYNNTVYTNIWSIIQKQIGIILESRSNLHKDINLNELNDVWTHTLDFVTVAGRLFGSRGKLLLSSLIKQVRSSLDYIHGQQLESLKNSLQHENWKPILISSDIQMQVSLMIEKPDEATYNLSSSPTNDMSAACPRLFIGTQYFCISNSVLECIKMIFVYILYAKSFQGLGTDVMYRIFDILKLYDSLTNNLILNAQAVVNGYLKRITAKHIAIVSHCIGCIHALLPHLQASLALYLPPLQHKILNELINGISQIYKEHHQQLLSKLPDMIYGIATKAVQDIPTIDWYSPAVSPSPYMEVIVKKINMLYNQLSPILSEEHIHFIFTEILHSCSKLLMTQFKKLDISILNQIARDRITGDTNAFLSALRNIPSLPDRGLEFEADVKKLLYAHTEMPTPQPIPTKETTEDLSTIDVSVPVESINEETPTTNNNDITINVIETDPSNNEVVESTENVVEQPDNNTTTSNQNTEQESESNATDASVPEQADDHSITTNSTTEPVDENTNTDNSNTTQVSPQIPLPTTDVDEHKTN